MSNFEPAEIVRGTCINHVEYHETLDSTNTLAVELLDDLLPLAPSLVLTADQTAGRGRGSNQWWASAGALTFSLVLDVNHLSLPGDRLSLVSLAVGLGVRNAISASVPDRGVCVKWPNDVLIGQHKVCGILVEQHSAQHGTALIIGVGLNVNNSLAAAPTDVRQRAASIFDLTAETKDLNQLLIVLVRHLEKGISQLQNRQMEMFAELNSVSCLNGREVSVQLGEELIAGFCRGVDSDGCLLLEGDGHLHRLNAGTVVEW